MQIVRESNGLKIKTKKQTARIDIQYISLKCGYHIPAIMTIETKFLFLGINIVLMNVFLLCLNRFV